MLKNEIAALIGGRDLSYDETKRAAEIIMTGEADEVQTAALLVAMNMRGETADEITAFAKTLRENRVKIDITSDCLDVVGTGGDRSGTFNISTCASFLAAACGVKVAKHGNGSVSSKCGAADVLDELGVNTKAAPEVTAAAFNGLGVAFLHAQVYHPAMRFAAPVRKKLGVRTIFNILGPLANPAEAKYQVLGVYSPDLLKPLCKTLADLGCTRAVAVNGGGCDEVSCFSPTSCCEFKEGELREYELTPEDFGVERCKKEDILGGDARRNAEIFNSVLSGEEGAYLTAAAINAAMCLYIYGVCDNLKAATAMAIEAAKSGKALRLFNLYREAVRA